MELAPRSLTWPSTAGFIFKEPRFLVEEFLIRVLEKRCVSDALRFNTRILCGAEVFERICPILGHTPLDRAFRHLSTAISSFFATRSPQPQQRPITLFWLETTDDEFRYTVTPFWPYNARRSLWLPLGQCLSLRTKEVREYIFPYLRRDMEIARAEYVRWSSLHRAQQEELRAWADSWGDYEDALQRQWEEHMEQASIQPPYAASAAVEEPAAASAPSSALPSTALPPFLPLFREILETYFPEANITSVTFKQLQDRLVYLAKKKKSLATEDICADTLSVYASFPSFQAKLLRARPKCYRTTTLRDILLAQWTNSDRIR